MRMFETRNLCRKYAKKIKQLRKKIKKRFLLIKQKILIIWKKIRYKKCKYSKYLQNEM